MSDVQPWAVTTPPPTILASSSLNQKLHPRHATLATQSETKQLSKQVARRQLRQQQRRSLPMTQYDFYTKTI
jgi:hypothetical protein